MTALTSRYRALAPRWHQKVSRLGYPHAYADLVRGAQNAGRTIDLGAGSGALSLAFVAETGCRQIDLLDTAPEMLEDAQTRLEQCGVTCRTFLAAIGSPAIEPASMDTLLCAHVVEHVPNPERALQWMRGRLRPGGQLFLVVSQPHWCTAFLRVIWGHKAFSPQKVERMLARAGFVSITRKTFSKGPPSRTSCGYIANAPG